MVMTGIGEENIWIGGETKIMKFFLENILGYENKDWIVTKN